MLPGLGDRPLVPSVLHFLPTLDYLVGDAAVEADRYRPSATLRHVKRDLGTSTCYEVDSRSIAPELATSLVLRSLKRNAEEALGASVHRCLASHPANFSLRQIEALERAYQLADLDVQRMIGEPNVAGLLASHQTVGKGDDFWCLVVDLGGGTWHS